MAMPSLKQQSKVGRAIPPDTSTYYKASGSDGVVLVQGQNRHIERPENEKQTPTYIGLITKVTHHCSPIR